MDFDSDTVMIVERRTDNEDLNTFFDSDIFSEVSKASELNTGNSALRRSAPTSFQQPASKRLRLEEKPEDEGRLKKLIIEWKNAKLENVVKSYNEHLLELYFLGKDGNLIDMQTWLKKPTAELMEFVKKRKLEDDYTLEVKILGSPIHPLKLKEDPQQITSSLNKNSTILSKGNKKLMSNVKHRLYSSYDGTPRSSHQDPMVEKARQEVYIIQKIASLRKEGLWSERRLPKVQEAPRMKTHWDYLLEEMVWLSADFAQERKWKKAAAKKCAKMVQKYFQDKSLQAQRAEKEQEIRLRKVAGFVAKEVRTFWSNVEKLIEFKVNTRLDEKKKKALDQQLSFIVGQTEKYSTMLAESMKKNELASLAVQPDTPSIEIQLSDDEFQPEDLSEDDEDTIGKEEDNPEEQASELKLLQKESEQTLEDVMKDLPPEYFENRSEDEEENDSMERESNLDSRSSSVVDIDKKESDESSEERLGKEDADKDFEAAESEDDDETTIQEQEEKESKHDYSQEIKELEAENVISVEELRNKYEKIVAESEPFEDDMESETDDEEDEHSDKDDESDNSRMSIGSEDSQLEDADNDQVGTEEEETLGLEDLLEQSFCDQKSPEMKERSGKVDKELKTASAVAESLQPKGFTLSSTVVTTPVPFLLRHQLREYQHVGLDWLVTMYAKKLNGILADEMGLGKTMQTIALLAHLACEKGIWGPHLIIVPTSVMLNWEMEFKKWSPAFKILTYYGTQKERKLKRQGWTKENAFHVCITSYKLVIQDHQSFRRKKWKYFILDEAQNIKNFKSQRWQLLLNFQSNRRLLLTGTPLQNSLMELWSLMHFLMPNIFASHREFREWFSNPVTGMIEGNKEYNESLIKRLHKVLRPFILRRLKCEVEQQMPKKFEHIIMCRLSKRQRFLYEEFMSRTKTKDTLESGNFLSVINILMQLRKVCNHPNLFEPRPIISPLMMSGICYHIPSLVCGITDYDPFKNIDLFSLNLLLIELELCLTAFAAHRIRKFQAPQRLIQEIDNAPDPPPKCPAGKIKLHVRPSSQPIPHSNISLLGGQRSTPSVLTLKPVNSANGSSNVAHPATLASGGQVGSQWQSGVRFQLIQHGGSYKAIPLPPGSTGGMIVQQTPQGPKLVMPQRTLQTPGITSAPASSVSPSTSTGLQLVQTPSGQYLLTSAPVQKPANSGASSIGLSGNTALALLQRLQGLKGLQGSVITTGAGGRPVLRLPTSSLRPNLQMAGQGQGPVASCVAVQKPSAQLLNSQGVIYTTSPVKASAVSSVPNSSLNNPPTTASPPKSFSRPQSNELKVNDITSLKKKDESSTNKSIFYLSGLEEERREARKAKLQAMAKLNTRQCHACPIYGSDLIEAVTVVFGHTKNGALSMGSFAGQGLVHSHLASDSSVSEYWYQTGPLQAAVKTPTKLLEMLRDTIDRYMFCVPAVVAPLPTLRVCHPSTSSLWRDQCREIVLRKELQLPLSPLHSIINASVTQFPDPRLIQYDCGKLQTLDRLLRRLKNEGHRILIFTQMTKMLDVFESFLNFHGHLYLRLDGNTRVDQRQVLMERFNQDKRIFVFILSTRSGGIGVNLTGADTVIFYDSDWNPTMDAQAQDRCHRIGQTRDVHIYRLISEKTIEENILKKANQKRLLGDLAIEGGNFTTAQLKAQTVHDLFEVDIHEQDPAKRMREVLEREKTQEEEDKLKMGDFENALAAAEDETDAEAAKIAKAEAAAELAEFDENIPLEDQDGEEVSKAEQEVAKLMKQLTPIEKFAMKFLEESDEGLTAEAERLAAEIDQQKKEWELSRLQALEEEGERLRQEEMDDLLMYSSIDSRNQVWISFEDETDIMPVWSPPTPPQDENDLYIDPSIKFWYGSTPMPESCLPPVYVKRENNKRIKVEPLTKIRGSPKMKREDGGYAPRSLFDSKRDAKRELKRTPLMALKPQNIMGAHKTPYHEPLSEWLIHEDWMIIQAIQKVLQLPLNLMASSHGHIPNWDLVADLVNAYSVSYRSLRQCRTRYENHLLTREENKEPPTSELQPRKMTKKNKNLSTRGLGTFQLFQQDNNSKFSSLCSTRYETIKSITVKKTRTIKPMHVNPASKNSKHAQILLEHGITYEEPLLPSHVAANRAERIREKQKTQSELVQSRLQQQNQLAVTQLQRQLQAQQLAATQQHIAVVTAASSGIGQQPSQQPVVVSTGGLANKVATSVVLNQGVGNAISVAGISTTASVATTNLTATSASTTTATATIFSGVRAAVASQAGGTGRATLTLQDLQGRTGSTQATVVSVASLAQLQAAKLTAASLSSQATQQRGIAGVPLQTRTLIPQQYLRQAQRQTLALHSGKVVATSTAGDQQTIKRVQIAGQNVAGQKVQVAVPGITAIQMVKPGSVIAAASTGGTSGAGKPVTRTVTESEMNALLRRQPQQLAKVGQIAQMLAKQRSLVGMKGATVGVQLGTKTGLGGTSLGTVQILQNPTQKHLTVQQFQQVVKQVQQQQQQQQQQPQTLQQGAVAGAVAGKATVTLGGNGSASLAPTHSTKLIPISVSGQQPIKQTIQVVTTGSTSLGAGTSGLRVSSGERSGITLQGNTVRVSSPTLLSLGSATFQGQPVSVAVKNASSNSVRIQTTPISTQQQQVTAIQESTQTTNQQ